MAAVGDFTRFRTPEKLVAYLGLNPRVRQSGGQPASHGRITKAGSAHARGMLVEAAWSASKAAGPLREPASRLQEVDAIVVNGAGWGHAGVFRAAAVVTKVYHLKDGAERTLDSFRKEPVHAVAGIGNPQRFFDLLLDADLDVEAHPLEDHAEITLDELTFDEPGAVLITEKDAVKCEHLKADGVWCVVVDFQFDADSTARLMRLVLRGIGARA